MKYKKILNVLIITNFCGINYIVNNSINNKILFVNNENVNIYEKDYKKFKSIDISDKEIKFINQSKYDEYCKINPIKTIKNISIHSETNLNIKKVNKEGYSSNSDSTRKIETYVTWYKTEDVSKSEFFVKVNVSYTGATKFRYTDYIGIGFGDEVNSSVTDVSNKGQRPTYTAMQFYTEHYYRYYSALNVSPQTTEYSLEKSVTKDRYNYDNYHYALHRDFIVDFDVPSDYYYKSTPNYEYAQINEEVKRTYSDFSYTLSQYFVPTYTNINNVSFIGAFTEMKEKFTIDNSQLSFSIYLVSIGISNFVSKEYFTDTIYNNVLVRKD